MTNLKKYKILYYVSFIATCILMIIVGIKMDELAIFSMSTLFIINLIFVLLFILLGRKYKMRRFSIVIPIIYLIFLVIIVILSFIMNSLLIISNIHFMYYSNFVLVGYLMMNIYSLLCLSK